jgi:hypothetical protein
MGFTRIAYHSTNSKLAKYKIPLLIGGLAEKRVFNKEITSFSKNIHLNVRKGEHCMQLVC